MKQTFGITRAPRRVLPLFVLFSLLVAFACGLTASAAEQCKTRCANGELLEKNGIRILRVWGTPEEMGYAQGRLLGEEIMASANEVVGLMAFKDKPNPYETQVLPAVRDRLIKPPAVEAEVAGLYRGVKDSVPPEKRYLKALKREATVDDIWAINLFSEWSGLMCSTAACWGPMTQSGKTVLGRNLDYTAIKATVSTHVAVARSPKDGKKWVSFTWSGLLGCYTGFEESGVVSLVHDVGVRATEPDADTRKFISRHAVFQRALLEIQDGPAFVENAAALLRGCPAVRGSNHFLATPTQAVVMEYDQNSSKEGGVTVRTPPQGQNWLVTTNHYRLRRNPDNCGRYAVLEKQMTQAAAGGGKIGKQEMWKIITQASQFGTLHTVVFDSSDRSFLVSCAGVMLPAHRKQPAELRWEDFFPENTAAER